MDNITAGDIWADLIAAHTVKRAPEGAKTAKDFSAETGLSVSQARELLNKEWTRGRMNRERFQVDEDDRGRPYHYWPVIEDSNIPEKGS